MKTIEEYADEMEKLLRELKKINPESTDYREKIDTFLTKLEQLSKEKIKYISYNEFVRQMQDEKYK